MRESIQSLLRSDTDHLWHVWINQYSEQQRVDKKPHPGSLYEYKSMVQALPWIGRQLGKERRGELAKVHQQCSHCAPEPIKENKLICCLGVECAKCEILISLRESVAKRGQFYDKITDEDVDHLCGLTCAWHIFTTATSTPADGGWKVDTTEGYILDESDRMFWSNLYESLASSGPDEPEEKAK